MLPKNRRYPNQIKCAARPIAPRCPKRIGKCAKHTRPTNIVVRSKNFRSAHRKHDTLFTKPRRAPRPWPSNFFGPAPRPVKLKLGDLRLAYVRFTPESGHQAARLACLLSAKSGLTQCSIPCHSITSLACASIVDGMSRPSVPLSGASIVNPGVFEFAGRQVPGRSLRTPNFHRDHREAERAGHCLNFTHIQQGDRIAGIGQNR